MLVWATRKCENDQIFTIFDNLTVAQCMGGFSKEIQDGYVLFIANKCLFLTHILIKRYSVHVLEKKSQNMYVFNGNDPLRKARHKFVQNVIQFVAFFILLCNCKKPTNDKASHWQCFHS